MTKEEIRKVESADVVGGGFDAGRPEFWLREIAAQLAEVNENLKRIGNAVYCK